MAFKALGLIAAASPGILRHIRLEERQRQIKGSHEGLIVIRQ